MENYIIQIDSFLPDFFPLPGQQIEGMLPHPFAGKPCVLWKEPNILIVSPNTQKLMEETNDW